MRNRVLVPLTATTLVMLVTTWAPIPAAGQSPPASALVNQRSAETREAARAASPHTLEETYAYFEDDAEAAIAMAIESVWDPTQPRPSSPRTPWSVEIPWPRMEPPGLFEYACHEQNYGLINVVTVARIRAAEYEAELTR